MPRILKTYNYHQMFDEYLLIIDRDVSPKRLYQELKKTDNKFLTDI
jgi:hypothetical protein